MCKEKKQAHKIKNKFNLIFLASLLAKRKSNFCIKSLKHEQTQAHKIIVATRMFYAMTIVSMCDCFCNNV